MKKGRESWLVYLDLEGHPGNYDGSGDINLILMI